MRWKCVQHKCVERSERQERGKGTLYYQCEWHDSYRSPLFRSIGRGIAGGDRAMLSISIKRSHPTRSNIKGIPVYA